MQFIDAFTQAFTGAKNTATHTVKTAATTAKVTGADIATKSMAQAPTILKTAAVTFGQGILANVIALEVVDAMSGAYYTRKRRMEIEAELVTLSEAFKQGDEEKINRINALLDAIPRRRTFGQVIRDLPSRTFRRVWRATLVETGWWTMILTSPVWLPVAAAYSLYSWLVVFPLNTVMEHFQGRSLDLEKWLVKPGRWVRKIFKWTVLKGWKIFKKGIEMRLHGRKMFAAAEEGQEILTKKSTKTYAQVKEIKDGQTAAAWGRALAREVSHTHLDPTQEQMAYANLYRWAHEHIAAQFRTAVMRGFREGTPFLYRDLVPQV